jgi:hypothetical protein
MSIKIRQIQSKKEKQAFVRLLWDIYASDPNWVPPLMMDRMKLIDEQKNPFYAHSETAWFLAEENGKIVGRIAAIVNRNHNELYNDKTGFFGFFESVNDQNVANSLFGAAEGFLRSKGMTQSWGPMNPSINDEVGLLVEGFDRPPVMLMTYNPPYYTKLIEQAGYGKVKDMYAWLLSQENTRTEKLERVVKALKARNNITIRPQNPFWRGCRPHQTPLQFSLGAKLGFCTLHECRDGFPRRRSQADLRSRCRALRRDEWRDDRVCAFPSGYQSGLSRRPENPVRHDESAHRALESHDEEERYQYASRSRAWRASRAPEQGHRRNALLGNDGTRKTQRL